MLKLAKVGMNPIFAQILTKKTSTNEKSIRNLSCSRLYGCL